LMLGSWKESVAEVTGEICWERHTSYPRGSIGRAWLLSGRWPCRPPCKSSIIPVYLYLHTRICTHVHTCINHTGSPWGDDNSLEPSGCRT
jgi:hypothetical protein